MFYLSTRRRVVADSLLRLSTDERDFLFYLRDVFYAFGLHRPLSRTTRVRRTTFFRYFFDRPIVLKHSSVYLTLEPTFTPVKMCVAMHTRAYTSTHTRNYTQKHTYTRKHERRTNGKVGPVVAGPSFLLFLFPTEFGSFLELVSRTIYTLANCLQVSSNVLLVGNSITDYRFTGEEKQEEGSFGEREWINTLEEAWTRR